MASEEERAKIMAEYLAGNDAAEDEPDFDPTDEVRLMLILRQCVAFAYFPFGASE